MKRDALSQGALELLRGRTGRMTGYLMGGLTMLKGLPSGYNRDFHEEKVRACGCVRARAQRRSQSQCSGVLVCVGAAAHVAEARQWRNGGTAAAAGGVDAHTLCAAQVIPPLVKSTTLNKGRMRELSHGNFAAATELANYLVRARRPLRVARVALAHAAAAPALRRAAPRRSVTTASRSARRTTSSAPSSASCPARTRRSRGTRRRASRTSRRAASRRPRSRA